MSGLPKRGGTAVIRIPVLEGGYAKLKRTAELLGLPVAELCRRAIDRTLVEIETDTQLVKLMRYEPKILSMPNRPGRPRKPR